MVGGASDPSSPCSDRSKQKEVRKISAEDSDNNNLSDVENFQVEEHDDSPQNDEEDFIGLDGDQQIDRLANKYMMKSPATLAMRRKSSSANPPTLSQ